MKRQLIPFCALALLMTGCTDSEKTAEATTAATEIFDLAAAKASVSETNAAFGKALNAGDSSGLAALYTSDALLMPANMPVFSGTNGITAFMGEGIRGGLKNLKLETTELTGNNEGLQEVGVYTFTDDKGVPTDKGKYIVLWKKEGGKWKLHRDIFNSDNPPPPPPPPSKK